MSALKNLAIVVAITLVSACAHLNEGQNEYRATVADSSQWHMYVDRSSNPSAQIKAGHTISLHLMHGFIKGFNEWITDFPNTIRGEIAIIANVFEVGKTGPVMDYADGNEKRSGRLIYYSDDVRQDGHHLNFSYLPIYGPINYAGGPLAIQFTILELDQFEGSRAKSMIGTLAKLGRSAYAPSSDTLKILDTLGESLLSGGDDREFKYTFYLMPPEGHPATKYPILMAGNYAIIKQEPYTTIADETFEWKFNKTNWNEITINNKDGLLYYQKTQGCDEQQQTCPDLSRAYESSTYLTFQINTGFKGDILNAAEAYSTFLKNMNDYDKEDGFSEKLKKMGKAISAFNAENEIILLADSIKEKCKEPKDVSACSEDKNKLYLGIMDLFDSTGKLQLTKTHKQHVANALVEAGAKPDKALEILKDKKDAKNLNSAVKQFFDNLFTKNTNAE